jgi:hypothetical protein
LGIHICGIRQSRVGGDNWHLFDPPLGEDSEHYRLHILKDNVVCRRLESTKAEFLYSKEDELSDFSLRQNSIWVKMCQVSPAVGPGFWRRKELIIV